MAPAGDNFTTLDSTLARLLTKGRYAYLAAIIVLSASLVTISEPELEDVNSHMRILSKRPIAALELSRTYVRGDIYEIARDALKLGRKESKALLEPLLPRESGTGSVAEPPRTEGREGGNP